MRTPSIRVAMIVMSLVVLATVPRFAAATGHEDMGPFTDWIAPINLGPVVNTPQNDQRGTISRDGLSLYFGSNRPGSVGTTEGSDLYVSQRPARDLPWGPPRKVEPLSSVGDDNAPSFSPNGHWVIFGSDRPGGCGAVDLWIAYRRDVDDDFGWDTPTNLGCGVNSTANDDGPTIFVNPSDERVTLYFTSNRPGGLGDFDIWRAEASGRLNRRTAFEPPQLEAALSSPRRDTRTTIRRDGLEMYITSNRDGSVPDATGAPSLDIWVATRDHLWDPWSAPTNVASVNTPANDGAPSLSWNGRTLYFDSTRPGGFGARDLMVTARKPIGRREQDE
jgi:WD40-like Beta Propeller Repeat